MRGRYTGRRRNERANLAVIICQLLSADDAVEVGLHKLLDDCIGREDEQIEYAA